MAGGAHAERARHRASQRANLAPGESWKTTLAAFGLDGHAAGHAGGLGAAADQPGRSAWSTSSSYPHGCLEQTTSSVFPQLYLPALIRMDQNRRLEIENNVRAGLARLRSMQHPSGGFAYWPGVWNTGSDARLAQRLGHHLRRPLLPRSGEGRLHPARRHEGGVAALPEGRRAALEPEQRRRAARVQLQRQAWLEAARYAQAYRLYTLALAGQPEIGAMNRLRETSSMSLGERWMLASTYQLAGKPEVAKALADDGGRVQAFVFSDANPYTFGSLLRDRAVVLMGMTLLGRDAESAPLLDDIAAQLSEWRVVQHAVAGLRAGGGGAEHRHEALQGIQLRLFLAAAGKARMTGIKGESPLANLKLPPPPAAGLPLALTNTSDRKLYVTAAVRAIPASGEEDASANGLIIQIVYSDADGKPVDVRRLAQGSDLHRADHGPQYRASGTLDNLALSQMVPAGWEIRNDRLEDVDTDGRTHAGRAADAAFWWVPNAWRQSDTHAPNTPTSATTACSATSAWHRRSPSSSRPG